jgi:hypothetical protein
MASFRTFVILAVPVLSSVATIGCATPRMAPPADVAKASEVLTVSDRSRAAGAFVNEGFKLGAYQIVDVNRKWTSTEGTGIGPWSKETKTTGFSYTLAAGGKKLPGKCSSVSKSQAIGNFSWGSLEIACSCEGEAGKAELVMTDTGRTMRMGNKEYKVEPINAVEGGGTQSNPTGFRVDGEEPLGAVEVVHPGQVWLKKGLDDATRAQTACTFVGLMLYKAPSEAIN